MKKLITFCTPYCAGKTRCISILVCSVSFSKWRTMAESVCYHFFSNFTIFPFVCKLNIFLINSSVVKSDNEIGKLEYIKSRYLISFQMQPSKVFSRKQIYSSYIQLKNLSILSHNSHWSTEIENWYQHCNLVQGRTGALQWNPCNKYRQGVYFIIVIWTDFL